jgi:hypothetical protein
MFPRASAARRTFTTARLCSPPGPGGRSLATLNLYSTLRERPVSGRYDQAPDSIGGMFADIHRRLKTLETAPRSALSASGTRGVRYSSFAYSPELTRYTAGVWDSLEFSSAGSYVVGPSLQVAVGPTQRLLCLFGCTVSISTAASGAGASDSLKMALKVQGTTTLDAEDCPFLAELAVDKADATVSASISCSGILSDILPGDATVEAQFLRETTSSSDFSVRQPWLLTIPL